MTRRVLHGALMVASLWIIADAAVAANPRSQDTKMALLQQKQDNLAALQATAAGANSDAAAEATLAADAAGVGPDAVVMANPGVVVDADDTGD